MKQFKNAKGRADVLLSQMSAHRLVINPDNNVIEDAHAIRQELNQMEGLTYAEKRQVVRGLKIDVESTVRKNLKDRELYKSKRRR